MFLNMLNDKEKKDFLDIAYYLSNVDNKFSEEEAKLISQYKIEMSIDEDYESDYFDRNIEDIIHSFVESEKPIIKMIFIELIALVFSDQEYHVKEQKIIHDFMDNYGVSKDKYEDIKITVNELNKVYIKLQEFITT